jgi:hypothetical protein
MIKRVAVILLVMALSLTVAVPAFASPPAQGGRYGPNAKVVYVTGDPEYVGGRWWVDVNQNGSQDAGDHYFLCPLLGPGSATP